MSLPVPPIIIVPEGKVAHIKFTEWLNSKTKNAENNVFYNELFYPIKQNTTVKNTFVFLQELYGPKGDLYGFLIVGKIDGVVKMFLFEIVDGVATPVGFNNTDAEILIGLDDYGMINQFTDNVSLSIGITDIIIIEIKIQFETIFGNRFPMFTCTNPNTGEIVSKGIMDANYPQRESSSYVVYFGDLVRAHYYTVRNMTNQKLRFEIELLDNFSWPYEIPANGTVNIPITPNSTACLKSIHRRKTITYK